MSERRQNQLIGATIALFMGVGLGIFLVLTHGWFCEFLSTALTLFFLAAGLFSFSRIGWQSMVPSYLCPPSTNPLMFWGLFGLWLFFPAYYFLGPWSDQFHSLSQKAQIYWADESCDISALRKLAKQAPTLEKNSPEDASPAKACTTRWARAIGGFRPGSCLELDDGQAVAPYCIMSIWQLNRFERATVHGGDIFVAQTAFGRPSAFLLPSNTVVDRIFYPWGQIVRTTDDPEEAYIAELMKTFWVAFFYLMVGSAFAIGLIC